MIKKVLLCAICAVFFSACVAPKQCRVAKNILIMPTAYSTDKGIGTEFGTAFQVQLKGELAKRFKDRHFTEGFDGGDSDLIIRLVLVDYSKPEFTDNLVTTGTGDVEVAVRIYDVKGNFIDEDYISRDLKKGTQDEVLKSIVDEAVKFIDGKCL